MTAIDTHLPLIYGTLIVPNDAVARRALAVLGGGCVEEVLHADREEDMEANGRLISEKIDEIFPPGPSMGGPFQTPSEVYVYGEDSNLSGVTIQVNTRPEDWKVSDHSKSVEYILDRLARVGVCGYMDIFDARDTHIERTIHVLSPHGVHAEAAAVLSEALR